MFVYDLKENLVQTFVGKFIVSSPASNKLFGCNINIIVQSVNFLSMDQNDSY